MRESITSLHEYVRQLRAERVAVLGTPLSENTAYMLDLADELREAEERYALAALRDAALSRAATFGINHG